MNCGGGQLSDISSSNGQTPGGEAPTNCPPLEVDQQCKCKDDKWVLRKQVSYLDPLFFFLFACKFVAAVCSRKKIFSRYFDPKKNSTGFSFYAQTGVGDGQSNVESSSSKNQFTLYRPCSRNTIRAYYQEFCILCKLATVIISILKIKTDVWCDISCCFFFK